MCGYDVVIGKIISAHGTGGMVKVYPYSDFPDRVHLLEKVELERESRRLVYHLEKASVHGSYWLIKFREIECRNEADKLRGSLVRIPRSERLLLPEGSYYHDQLEGLKVYDQQGGHLGVVTGVIPGGGHDQILVSRAGDKERTSMIPAVKNFIRQVDLSKGIMVVELPEGMLDL